MLSFTDFFVVFVHFIEVFTIGINSCISVKKKAFWQKFLDKIVLLGFTVLVSSNIVIRRIIDGVLIQREVRKKINIKYYLRMDRETFGNRELIFMKDQEKFDHISSLYNISSQFSKLTMNIWEITGRWTIPHNVEYYDYSSS